METIQQLLDLTNRNRLFSYAGYIEIMRCGTELPDG